MVVVENHVKPRPVQRFSVDLPILLADGKVNISADLPRGGFQRQEPIQYDVKLPGREGCRIRAKPDGRQR